VKKRLINGAKMRHFDPKPWNGWLKTSRRKLPIRILLLSTLPLPEIPIPVANKINSPSLSTAIDAWKRWWQSGKGKNQSSKVKNNKMKQKTKNITQNKERTMKQYQQRTLLGTNLDLQDVEEFGGPLHAKQEGVLCLGLHNPANLSQDKRTSKS
jgi:hypothetical protein